MPVESVDPRGENPAVKLTEAIEALEKKGEIHAIVPLWDVILIHWTPRKREQREQRG